MARTTKAVLQKIYQRLYSQFGPQSWWPAKTRFEVMVGAILTQNTNWKNVEKALINLEKKSCLNPQKIRKLSHAQLALLIKPAGYFNVKAKRLKNFIAFYFKEYNADIEKMKGESLEVLREKLLSVNGIGPETADSILLYALDKPIFVIDAYTKRLLYRHGLIEQDSGYHDMQKIFMDQLSQDVRRFNEYHALIVHVGKNYCKPKPNCELCPLNSINYSLTSRCSQCHRVLFKEKKCLACG